MKKQQSIKKGTKKKEEKPVTARIGGGFTAKKLTGTNSDCHEFQQGTGCFRKVPIFFN